MADVLVVEPTTRVGDRIRITAIGEQSAEHRLAVGAEHTVTHVGRTSDGAIWVAVAGDGPAVVSSIGDRWTVLGDTTRAAAVCREWHRLACATYEAKRRAS